MNFQFTEDDIRRLAGSDMFFRGRDCFLERRVALWTIRDGVLSANVRSGGKLPYQVKTSVFDKEEVHSDCTCPDGWGALCEHAVAALLAVASKEQRLALATRRVLRKTPGKVSLLFPHNDRLSNPPVIRFMLPTRHNFGASSNGIKVETAVIYREQTSEVWCHAQLIDPKDQHYGRNKALPALADYNAAQRHCLRLMHGFTARHIEEVRLQPHELALLLRESEGEGIEFFEGKHQLLNIRRDKYVPVLIEIEAGAKNTLQVYFFTLHPDDPGRHMQGSPVNGRFSWFINFNDGFILPFADIFDEHTLQASFNLNGGMALPRLDMPEFVHSVLARLKDHARIVYKDKAIEHVHVQESSPAVQVHLDGSIVRLRADIRFVYSGRSFSLRELMYAPAYLPVDGQAIWIKRDIAKERQSIKFLCEQCRFRFNGNQQLVLDDADHIAHFIFEQVPSMAQRYEVYYAPGVEEKFKSKTILRPKISFGADDLDWFYFDVKYAAPGIDQEFSQEEIRRQLLQGKKYVRLKSGDVIPIAREEFDKVERLSGEFDGRTKNLPVFHVPFILEEAGRQNLEVILHGKFRDLQERLKQFRSITAVEPPEPLKGILRDYQCKGLDWMEFLRGFRFGGILADEMGLGKTLQVLALFKAQIEAKDQLPNLVICPTTLVWNWQEEIKKFLPDLKVLAPQGIERRKQIRDINDYQVVITSYALLRRDAKCYEKFKFNYVVLDEAQNIKNRHTVNAHMSKQLKSRHRLVLTGTPMENSVADLWSIFDFLMPGFLGGYERFKFRYENPILKDQNKETLETLARKIKPFILRRLKKEVLKELPEKMEQISLCELEPTQGKTYAQMLAIARKEVTHAYETQGLHKSRMKILTVILRLRQICCHPQLAHVNLGHRLSVSAKLNLLKEIVQEALSGGHKILIFSQFVGMLAIIAEYLKKEGIVFEYMDGATKDRPAAVERFNASKDVRIFLLSLKVGGVGLNLTSADVVILYEPWWNPAVEDQAIDRAHRIGQKSTVTAYKLICKGTIEEKILELQRRKKNIIDSLVVSERGIAKTLGWEDIKFLLDIE